MSARGSAVRQWVVDAFADRPFEGNPAAVTLLERFAPDHLLQKIAAENNLSETAFLAPSQMAAQRFHLRWFTPLTEVRLCGHATLAAAHVLLRIVRPELGLVVFDTLSGTLIAGLLPDDMIAIELPARPREPWANVPRRLVDSLGQPEITDAFLAGYANLVLADEAAVRALAPDPAIIAELSPILGCLAVSAPAGEALRARGIDFVNRFFAPGVGVVEDPLTGSSYCDLAPYWGQRLGRREVTGYQASSRGGRVACHDLGRTVRLSGRCQVFSAGELYVSGL
jgi:PhzF family phenazine biosynthesis protein